LPHNTARHDLEDQGDRHADEGRGHVGSEVIEDTEASAGPDETPPGRSEPGHAAEEPGAGDNHEAALPVQGESERALTAAEFTAERMLRRHSAPPTRGLPLLLYRMTRGLVRLGPTPAELRERELIARAKTPVTGSRRIVVISRKGGVGKTTTALMLGHTFATYRGDRVLALDGNPDAGSLGQRVRSETTATISDLLRDSKLIDRYADIRAYTSQSSTRMEVVASDDDPRITEPLGPTEYKQLVNLLERHYNLIVLDTGTGILGGATRGFIDLADQLILVTQPNLDGSRVGSLTLDWLEEHGYGHLVKGAVTVINGVRRRGLVELDRIDEHFRRRCREVTHIPWDGVLQAGAETALAELRPATQRAYLDLAAAVADGFGPRWWMSPAAQT
jgi:putative peptide zinc metalloprotease protein